MTAKTTDETTPKRKLKRALNANEIKSIKNDPIGFEGEFYDAFGVVPKNCSILIYGESGSGKSTFTMTLAKYLCQWANEHGRVHYGAFEEHADASSFIERVKEFEIPKSFQAVTESWDDFKERIRRRQSAHFIFIDSVDKALRKIKKTDKAGEMIDFMEEFHHKFIIMIGHGKGSRPNALSEELEFEADIKVLVRSGMALVKSRFLKKGCTAKFEIRRELYNRNTDAI